MTLFQKLFLSLFISMIISPKRPRDRSKRIFEKEPSLKDLKHGEINEVYTETDDDRIDLKKSKDDKNEAETMEKVNKDSAFVDNLLDLSIPYQPTRENVHQATSSQSVGGVMLVHMSPHQLKVSRKPLDGIDKYQFKEEKKERYKKYKTNEPQKDEKDKYQYKLQRNEYYRKYRKQMKEAKPQQSQKYSSVSDSELDDLIKDAESKSMEYNKYLIVRITDKDGQLQKYETENKDQPYLVTAIKNYISYQNEKGNPLKRKYEEPMIKVYDFFGYAFLDAVKYFKRLDEDYTKISYGISTDECGRIQSDIDRNSCYEFLIALKKHGIPVFAHVLWNLEEKA